MSNGTSKILNKTVPCKSLNSHGKRMSSRCYLFSEVIKVKAENEKLKGFGDGVLFCTIPYKFHKNGYSWSLLSVKNDFSKPEDETLVYAEYENQYGHTKQFTLEEFRS